MALDDTKVEKTRLNLNRQDLRIQNKCMWSAERRITWLNADIVTVFELLQGEWDAIFCTS